MKSVKRWALAIRESLESPSVIFLYCVGFFIATVSLNGTPLRLWGLHRDLDRRNSEIQRNMKDIEELGIKIAQAKDPAFIEREARDRLDLANENELIFVFPTQ